MADYRINGREIHSDKGKLVATLDDDGNLIFAPGMAGAHSRAVNAFLANRVSDALDFAEDMAGSLTGGAEPKMPEYEPPVVKENLTTESAADGKVNVFVGEVPRKPSPPAPEAAPAEQPGADEWFISTIPDDQLPPFSPEFGVETPGFPEFVKKHKLTTPQVAALIKRLTK